MRNFLRTFVAFVLVLSSLIAVPVTEADAKAKPVGAAEKPVVVKIDSGLTGRTVKPPEVAKSGPRPIGYVVGPQGEPVPFVTNELVVVLEDLAAVNRLAKRLRGRVLLSSAPSKQSGAPRTHLVQVNPTSVSVASLGPDLAELSDGPGALRVSSRQGAQLLAIAAREAVNGLTVGINWIGEPYDIESGETSESPIGPAGFPSPPGVYSSDAFDWAHLNNTGSAAYGVTDAWQLLEGTGLIENRVKVAALDMGFDPATNGDFPASTVGISTVPFRDPLSSANLAPCSASFRCLWHGTGVMNTMAGVIDNQTGAAGVAGPVADPIAIYTFLDHFSTVNSLIVASNNGAKVANMSFGVDLPGRLGWTALPLQLTTAALSRSMVLVAAAGNSGSDVDATICLPFTSFCAEPILVAPCENIGVTCVGGVSPTRTVRHSSSSFGATDVDLFAPFCALTGKIQSSPAFTRLTCGTSIAAPYVSGVVALIWSANPGLSANGVRSVLLGSAQRSTDTTVGSIVQPAAAVRRAISQPVIRITRPDEGSSTPAGFQHFFEAFAFDDGRGDRQLEWSVDGRRIFNDNRLRAQTAPLPPGEHTVTVVARYSDRSTASDTVRFTVQNEAPRIAIVTPRNGATFSQTFRFDAIASSSDRNERLDDSQIEWFINSGRFPVARGHAATILLPSRIARYELCARATDSQGATGEHCIFIARGR